MPVVLGLAPTGVQRNLGLATANVALGVLARADAPVDARIVWSCSASVGSVFTNDANFSVVFGCTPTPAARLASTTTPVVVGFTIAAGEISGGTISAEAVAAIAVNVSAYGNAGDNVAAPIIIDCTVEGVRLTRYRTPLWRCHIVRTRHRRR